jgi:hypothetical protein
VNREKVFEVLDREFQREAGRLADYLRSHADRIEGIVQGDVAFDLGTYVNAATQIQLLAAECSQASRVLEPIRWATNQLDRIADEEAES